MIEVYEPMDKKNITAYVNNILNYTQPVADLLMEKPHAARQRSVQANNLGEILGNSTAWNAAALGHGIDALEQAVKYKQDHISRPLDGELNADQVENVQRKIKMYRNVREYAHTKSI